MFERDNFEKINSSPHFVRAERRTNCRQNHSDNGYNRSFPASTLTDTARVVVMLSFLPFLLGRGLSGTALSDRYFAHCRYLNVSMKALLPFRM